VWWLDHLGGSPVSRDTMRFCNESSNGHSQLDLYCWEGTTYTWLDVPVDVAGEQGYAILGSNGDRGEPATILINDKTLASARKLIGQLRELGSRVDTASEAELANADEARVDINEILAGEFEQLLLKAGLVEPLVASEGA
jgi:hypothetical protein